jgi:hypothetical protein
MENIEEKINYQEIYQDKKIFNSIDYKHQIIMTIIDNTSWFNINIIDLEFYKTFLLLLKEVLIFLKNKNIVYIKQYVYEEDIEYFKKSSIVNIDMNIYVVTTNIIDFISEITNVLGIKIL